jgi:hypothetical protein
VIRLRLRRRSRKAAHGSSADLDSLLDAEQALDATEYLVAQQNLAEAIRLLTEANRRWRDPRLEKRLVDLRFDAYRETEWGHERPEWPRCVEDLFPGERIPEVASEQLTVERLRSGITHHGSLLVRGLANGDRVEQLTRDIDQALVAFDTHTAGKNRSDLEGWFQPFTQDGGSNRRVRRKRGAVLAVDSPPALFDLVETLEHAGADRLAREYFAEPPMMLAKKVVLRRVPPHEMATEGWHQDGAFMGVGIRSLNIWLSLSHCGDDAPGLDVVGRRLDELVETGGEGTFNAWATNPRAAERFGAGAVVRPIFEPGDALLLDHLTLHRTAADAGMANDRYAIETWLFSPSTYDAMTASGGQGYEPRDQLPILF